MLLNNFGQGFENKYLTKTFKKILKDLHNFALIIIKFLKLSKFLIK